MSNPSDFVIENGVLIKYVGPGGDVAIPEGVTSIGSFAFADCSKLEHVTIPEGVTSISGSAFSGCGSLTSVTIPEGVTSIGSSAFSGCRALTGITIPDSVTEIGDRAFFYCPELTSISLSEKWIKSAGAAGLKKLFSDWLYSLRSDFCKGVPFKAILDGTAQYNDALFKTLTAVITSKNTRADVMRYLIRENRADRMERFLSLMKKSDLREIDEAIELASQSEKAEVSAVLLEYKRVRFPAERVEQETTRREEIELGIEERTIPELRELFSVHFDQDTIQISGYKGTDETVSVPPRADGRTVTEIMPNAFSKDEGRKENPLIKEIILPNTIQSIQRRAFSRCVNLESITMSAGLESLGEYAFYECRSLKQIEIPAGVNSIGANPFILCSALTQISVDPKNRSFASSEGVLYSKDLTKLISYPAGRDGGSVPESVTAIAAGAFSRCGKLRNAAIPANVAAVEDGAFECCPELETLSLQAGLERIGNKAFAACDKLTEAILPNGLKELGESAFWACKSLKTVAIPGTVSRIAPKAFQRCKKLTKLSLEEGTAVIGEAAFAACVKLKDLHLPASIREIGENAFTECESLKSIVIPEGATNIGEAAFSACNKLTNISIPASVTNIGEQVFSYCPNLTIHAPAGSYAEQYAKENNIPFAAE